jgi:hypothetical protein
MNDAHPRREATCGNCRFYREADQGAGTCHRYPPTFAGEQSPRELHRWRFPLVAASAWCGEHQAVNAGAAGP